METFNIEKVIRDMARPAIKLDIAGEGGAAVGRFGGRPDVPADFVWPVFETSTYDDDTVRPRPLSFLARFDCAALAPLDKESLLPREGVLSFFYELGSQCWGYDPKNAGCARVFWFPDRDALAPADFPEALERDYRLPEFEIRASGTVTYPDFADFSEAHREIAHPAHWDQIRGGWAGFCEEFYELSEKLRNEGMEPCHDRLLGWPDIIQNNMTTECELVSRGHYLGGTWEEIPQADREAAERDSLEDWRLLFQLNSVEQGDFCLDFGDCGSVYFYIRKEDLAARRFDRVWLILQCY